MTGFQQLKIITGTIILIALRGIDSRIDNSRRCHIPETLHGNWYSREGGENTYTEITGEEIDNRGVCLELLNTNNDNFTIVLRKDACYHCVRLFVRTLNVLEKIEAGCVSVEAIAGNPDIKTICKNLDPNEELITLFSMNPTAKNCRSSLEGVWKFAYQNRFKFTGECKHPEANITSCQTPGTQFFILNQQFNVNYRKCEGMSETEDGEVQYKCLGDWYIGKNHFFAVVNARESRIDEKFRCMLGNRDDDSFLAVSITPECNTLKTPQEGPERLRLEPVKTDIVDPKCKLPENFTGEWMNTANFDAEVMINSTHIVEHWKPDQGREKMEVYVCQEWRDSRFILARLGINGCQKDYVCFEFVARHQNVIRYRRGKAMMVDEFSTVCNWAMFPGKAEWRYDLFIAKNPVSIKCPVAGKFKFEQKGEIPFETRIRGGVTLSPRPNVYCKENISDFSVCDKDQKIINIDADYCISVDYFGRPIDIYSEPDYKMQCIGFWKENLKSYLITYDQEDAYSKYRCWVYQRADLNRVLMSESVGAFCHIKQDVGSFSSREGAQVALSMIEYEREHDDCPMYFDDGSDPYRIVVDQALQLGSYANQIKFNLITLFLTFLVLI